MSSKEKLLLEPKCVIPEEYKDRKVFFLAGPIRGGGNWQIQAAEMLWEKYPGCIVADPTRWNVATERAVEPEEKNKILEHRKNAIGAKDEKLYPVQASWESDHMKLASATGTLIFWFEKESASSPRSPSEGVYAQDTRVEAGIWIERLHNNPNLKVKFGGHWELDESGHETKNSFGGMNFIVFYLTGEKDRRKIYRGEVSNNHLVLAPSLSEFITAV